MDLYERIKILCKKNNMTGKELGERLGLKKSPLTDWKNNKSKPTIDQLIKMCEIFAVSSEFILFGKEKAELDTEEQKLLIAYRKANPAIQLATRKLLDMKETGEDMETLSPSKIG